MKNYWAAYKALRVTTGTNASGSGLGISSKKPGLAGVELLDTPPPLWQPALCKISERGSTPMTDIATIGPPSNTLCVSTDDSHEPTTRHPLHPLPADTTQLITSNNNTTTNNNTSTNNDTTTPTTPYQWALCAVCEADVTWAYIMHRLFPPPPIPTLPSPAL